MTGPTEKQIEAAMTSLFGEFNVNSNYHAWITPTWGIARERVASALTAALAVEAGAILDAPENAEAKAAFLEDGYTLTTSPASSGVEGEAVKGGEVSALTQALSRLSGNRQDDGYSSLVSSEDRETIISGCYDLLIAARCATAPAPAGEWQCRDHADGWISFPSLTEAVAYHRETGAVMRPASPAPHQEGRADG